MPQRDETASPMAIDSHLDDEGQPVKWVRGYRPGAPSRLGESSSTIREIVARIVPGPTPGGAEQIDFSHPVPVQE